MTGHDTGTGAGTGHSIAGTTGRNVLVALAVATAVEFAIALAGPPGVLVLLLLVALVKAWLILVHFMHIGNLRPEPATGAGPTRGGG